VFPLRRLLPVTIFFLPQSQWQSHVAFPCPSETTLFITVSRPTRTPVKFFTSDVVPSFFGPTPDPSAPSAPAADRQPRVGLAFLPARCPSRLCFPLNHVRRQIAHSRLSVPDLGRPRSRRRLRRFRRCGILLREGDIGKTRDCRKTDCCKLHGFAPASRLASRKTPPSAQQLRTLGRTTVADQRFNPTLICS
jgi:hypothetical protein